MKATPEQIKEWKDKHGQIFELEVEGKYCYVSDPLKKVVIVKALMQALNKGSFEYVDALLANCWIGGDDSIKADDQAKMGLIDIATQLIDLPEPEVDLESEPNKAVVTVGDRTITLRMATRQDIKYSEDRNKQGKILESQIHLLEKLAPADQLREWKEDVPSYMALLLCVDKLKERKYVALKKL